MDPLSSVVPSRDAGVLVHVPSRPPRIHVAGLDGLRALAVIAVFLYHVDPGWLPGGFLGVDVFFVLSGYLITALLLRERAVHGRPRLGTFWVRRARRLLPALAVVLVVCPALAVLVGGDVLVGIGRQLLGAVTYSSNWLDVAANSSYFERNSPRLFTHLWSLAVEEQFYILWPLVLAAILHRFRSRAARSGTALALALASATAMALIVVPGQDPTRVYFGTDTHCFGLMLGAALALWYPRSLVDPRPATSTPGTRWGRTLAAGSPVCLLAVVGLMAVLSDQGLAAYRGGILLATLLTLAVVASLVRGDSRLGRILDAGPLRWIGLRSYGLYLWHWPVLVLVRSLWPGSSASPAALVGGAVVAAAATTGAAVFSYRFVELPVHRLGLRGAARAFWRLVRTEPPAPLRIGPGQFAATGLVAALVLTTVAVGSAPPVTSTQQQIEQGERIARQSMAAAAAAPAPAADPVPTGTSAPIAGPGGTPAAGTPAPGTPAPPTATPGRHREGRARAVPKGPQITAVGDSVMLASAAGLQGRFPGIAIDAVVSRQFAEGSAVVSQLASTGRLRPVLVLALGTNGPFDASALDQLLHVVGPDRRVVLVNVYEARPWQNQVNRTIAAAARHRRNVTVADWHGAVQRHRDVLGPDGIHPGPAGGRLYAQVLARTLRG